MCKYITHTADCELAILALELSVQSNFFLNLIPLSSHLGEGKGPSLNDITPALAFAMLRIDTAIYTEIHYLPSKIIQTTAVPPSPLGEGLGMRY